MRDFYPKTLVEVKRQIWIFFIDVGALHLISLKGSYKQAFPFQPCKTPVKASRRYQVVGLVLANQRETGTLSSAKPRRERSLEEVGRTLERKEGNLDVSDCDAPFFFSRETLTTVFSGWKSHSTVVCPFLLLIPLFEKALKPSVFPWILSV